MSFAAYQRAAQSAESPRQVEYRLLGDVCRELKAVSEGEVENNRRLEALDWNRRVWLTLALDCGQPENQLPQDLRVRLVQLGVWVYKYTEDAMWAGADIQPLLDVNLSIMKGLAAAQAAEAA
jgi:flagellar protein FlaF